MTLLDNNAAFLKLMFKHRAGSLMAGEPQGVGELEPDKLEKALDLIDQGLDYTDLDDDGRSVFGVMALHVKSGNQPSRLTLEMVDKEMNPLLLPAKDQRQFYLDKVLRNTVETVLAGFEELGDGLRNEVGGNFYHSMASIAPMDLKNSLDARNWKGLDPYQSGRLAWIDARDDEGYTPLLRLWDPKTRAGAVERIRIQRGQIHMDLTDFMEDLSRSSAQASVQLLHLGADPLAQNKDGVGILEMISDLDLGSLGDEAASHFNGTIQAMTQEKQLGEQTPQAPVRSKPSARL